jgi:hypothetical protein
MRTSIFKIGALTKTRGVFTLLSGLVRSRGNATTDTQAY